MDKGSGFTKRFTFDGFYNYVYQKIIEVENKGLNESLYSRWINLLNIKRYFQSIFLDKKYKQRYFALAKASEPCPACEQDLAVVVVFENSSPTEGDSGEVYCFHDLLHANEESLHN